MRTTHLRYHPLPGLLATEHRTSSYKNITRYTHSDLSVTYHTTLLCAWELSQGVLGLLIYYVTRYERRNRVLSSRKWLTPRPVSVTQRPFVLGFLVVLVLFPNPPLFLSLHPIQVARSPPQGPEGLLTYSRSEETLPASQLISVNSQYTTTVPSLKIQDDLVYILRFNMMSLRITCLFANVNVLRAAEMRQDYFATVYLVRGDWRV
ncbi:hypothetical protein C8R48DRAFT_263825 [Suillus tomentosus]|nr:hypothetical protein C8R48DRAFT_263825 [Suillus tomentosus]